MNISDGVLGKHLAHVIWVWAGDNLNADIVFVYITCLTG